MKRLLLRFQNLSKRKKITFGLVGVLIVIFGIGFIVGYQKGWIRPSAEDITPPPITGRVIDITTQQGIGGIEVNLMCKCVHEGCLNEGGWDFEDVGQTISQNDGHYELQITTPIFIWSTIPYRKVDCVINGGSADGTYLLNGVTTTIDRASDLEAGAVIDLLAIPPGSPSNKYIYGRIYNSPGSIWEVGAIGIDGATLKIRCLSNDREATFQPFTPPFSSLTDYHPENAFWFRYAITKPQAQAATGCSSDAYNLIIQKPGYSPWSYTAHTNRALFDMTFDNVYNRKIDARLDQATGINGKVTNKKTQEAIENASVKVYCNFNQESTPPDDPTIEEWPMPNYTGTTDQWGEYWIVFSSTCTENVQASVTAERQNPETNILEHYNVKTEFWESFGNWQTKDFQLSKLIPVLSMDIKLKLKSGSDMSIVMTREHAGDPGNSGDDLICRTNTNEQLVAYLIPELLEDDNPATGLEHYGDPYMTYGATAMDGADPDYRLIEGDTYIYRFYLQDERGGCQRVKELSIIIQ